MLHLKKMLPEFKGAPHVECFLTPIICNLKHSDEGTIKLATGQGGQKMRAGGEKKGGTKRNRSHQYQTLTDLSFDYFQFQTLQDQKFLR